MAEVRPTSRIGQDVCEQQALVDLQPLLGLQRQGGLERKFRPRRHQPGVGFGGGVNKVLDADKTGQSIGQCDIDRLDLLAQEVVASGTVFESHLPQSFGRRSRTRLAFPCERSSVPGSTTRTLVVTPTKDLI